MTGDRVVANEQHNVTSLESKQIHTGTIGVVRLIESIKYIIWAYLNMPYISL